MEVIYGLVAAFCFYLSFDSIILYWKRYRAGEVIIPNRLERQTLLTTIVMFVFSIVMTLCALGVIKIA